jgi:hypothetical protein
LCFWIDRFLESLSSHIRSTLSVISPLQEVNGLVEQFDRMSVQAKIIFASKSNAENMFDISRMMNDIPVSQEELLNIFEIKLIKNPDKSSSEHVLCKSQDQARHSNKFSSIVVNSYVICFHLRFSTRTAHEIVILIT